MQTELFHINVDGCQVGVELKRHPRATKIKLRIAQVGGGLTVTAPPHVKRSIVIDFVQHNETWIRQEKLKTTAVVPVAAGMAIPYLGNNHTVVFDGDGKRSVNISDGIITVGGDAGLVGSRIERHFRGCARERALMTMAYSADILGVKIPKLSIGDTKTRWGSCSSRGLIRLSWRLIMAPAHIFDYVVSHEMAHILEMNHSSKFWAQVERIDSDWQHNRKWLKSEGSILQSYDFKSY